MTSNLENYEPPPSSGKVVRVLPDFGFISSPEITDIDIYFKTSEFRGSPPLKQGDEVTFQVTAYEEGKYTASNISRQAQKSPARSPDPDSLNPMRGAPKGYSILDWAYCGHLPNTLSDLASMALVERWEFQNAPYDPAKPFPILRSYLIHTFGRLVLEGKILVDSTDSWAAFNTGLVDPRYEPIHAIFRPNDNPSNPWRLEGFCIPGEGWLGQNLVRHFSPLPPGAHYFENPIDLLYDARVGKPELDWRHIIIDNIDRYPDDFLEDHWPQGFTRRNDEDMGIDERETYYRQLGAAIEGNNRRP